MADIEGVVRGVKGSITYDDGQNVRMSDLLPCPICGGEAYVQYGPEWPMGMIDARVVCSSCHVSTSRETSSGVYDARTGEGVARYLAIGKARDVWNRRFGGMMQYRKLRVMMDDDACYVPEYAHEGDAGLDLRAVEDVTLQPGESALIRTGLHVEIPAGCVGLEFPRSGLGTKGLTMRNAVGVIDSGYRGEVRCALWNTTDEPYEVRRGDRICQMVVMPYCPCTIEESHELSDSERGTDGYGSTGVR